LLISFSTDNGNIAFNKAIIATPFYYSLNLNKLLFGTNYTDYTQYTSYVKRILDKC